MKGAILNYGVGNLFSIKKAFEAHTNVEVSIVETADISINILKNLDFLIFPGVGHFTAASKALSSIKEPILDAVESGLSIFGICLGLQLLGMASMEGDGRGLGILEGDTVRFPEYVKIPHMGWNIVEFVIPHTLFEEIEAPYFYFAHSYYLNLEDRRYILGLTNYGVVFPSIICKDLVIGVQFHPEKSGESGTKLVKNYLGMIKR